MAKRWETTETVTDSVFFGSKITADGEGGHEIKICLLLGRKAMPNLDSILKSREFTLLTKVHLIKAMVFLIVMYRCESWPIKEPIIQSEVSQKEKHQYSILTHIYGI